MEDGSFIGCGQAPFLQPDSTIQSGWVIKLSATGDLLWERGYEGFNTPLAYNFLYDIDVLPDGGFIACGEAREYDDGQFGWILRLDSNGCVIENCMVGVDEVAKPEPVEVKVYPNPATETVNIELNPICERCLVEIIDVFGRLVLQRITYSENKLTILTGEWARGLYLVRVSQAGAIHERKFHLITF